MEMLEKQISLSEEMYAKLQSEAKKYDLTPEQLTEQLLNKEIQDMEHKEIFSSGLKWNTPKAKLIMARIPESEYSKLRVLLGVRRLVGLELVSC